MRSLKVFEKDGEFVIESTNEFGHTFVSRYEVFEQMVRSLNDLRYALKAAKKKWEIEVYDNLYIDVVDALSEVIDYVNVHDMNNDEENELIIEFQLDKIKRLTSSVYFSESVKKDVELGYGILKIDRLCEGDVIVYLRNSQNHFVIHKHFTYCYGVDCSRNEIAPRDIKFIGGVLNA